jgi:hypothetical protein
MRLRDIYEHLTPEERGKRGKSLRTAINQELANRAARQGRAFQDLSRSTIQRALADVLKNSVQK